MTDIFDMPTPFKFNFFFSVSILIIFHLLFSRKFIFTELGTYLKSVLQKSAELDAFSASIKVALDLIEYLYETSTSPEYFLNSFTCLHYTSASWKVVSKYSLKILGNSYVNQMLINYNNYLCQFSRKQFSRKKCIRELLAK